jgi:hypothetical protein
MTENKKTLSRKIKDIFWLLLRKVNLGGAVQLMMNGGILEDGWYKSYNSKTAIDKQGKPIPWCTYPYIKFIEPRLKRYFNAFEFGCGNSTLWYAERVGKIKSVEHDKSWYEQISKRLPGNSSIVHVELIDGGDYSKEVLTGGEKYDIIIVDGRDRVNCIKNSIPSLSNEGVIVFDNSDRPQYKEGIDILLAKGFKKIDFIGLSPVTPHNNFTSVFYKTNNCLEI